MLEGKNGPATKSTALVLLLGLLISAGQIHAGPSAVPFGTLRCESLLPKRSYAQSFATFETSGSTVVTSQHAYGPVLTYHADPSLVGPMGPSIRVGTYNMENLFENVQNADRPGVLEKEKERRLGNAREIRAIDPDFQVLVEIENIKALENFNRDYLSSDFQPLLIEGNDARGIDLAILIRRTLPVDVIWRSYKEMTSADGSRVFSRDLPVGLIFERGADGTPATAPRAAIVATHFKSQRVEPGQPDTTADRRRMQALAAVEIIKQVRKEFGGNLPIILAGDFNNDVHGSPEFKALFDAGFQDTLDLLPRPPQGAARVTQYYFPRNAPPETGQLDAILLLARGASVTGGRVIPDLDINGKPMPPPKSFEERETRPSDHRPIGVEIVLPK